MCRGRGSVLVRDLDLEPAVGGSCSDRPRVLDALVGVRDARGLVVLHGRVHPVLALHVEAHLRRAEGLGLLLEQVGELLGIERLLVVADAPGALEEVHLPASARVVGAVRVVGGVGVFSVVGGGVGVVPIGRVVIGAVAGPVIVGGVSVVVRDGGVVSGVAVGGLLRGRGAVPALIGALRAALLGARRGGVLGGRLGPAAAGEQRRGRGEARERCEQASAP